MNKMLGCLRYQFIGDEILHSSMEIMINHDKDPFSTTSKPQKVSGFFLWLACVTHFSKLQLENYIHWSFIEGMPDEN